MGERYEHSFGWETPYGHLVRLLEAHLEGGTLVLDLGCGYGPIAEPLAERGFQYVGCDVDGNGLASLRRRGFEVHELDLNEAPMVADRLFKAVDGRVVGVVLMIDSLEHLYHPDGLLAALRSVALDMGEPMLGVSIPNLGHFDLAAKLLIGRWDVTPTGLLDRTHLHFFNEEGLTDRFSRTGWFEVARNDFPLEASDQHFPSDSPVLVEGAPLHDFLRYIRDAAGDGGGTNQFVRLFRLQEPAEDLALEPVQSPFLSVLLRTQGTRMANLLEALTCLAAQEDPDFEVLVLVHAVSDDLVDQVHALVISFDRSFADRVRILKVTDGGRSRPLNIGLDEARGSLVAFLDDDDLVTANWVSTFREGAQLAPCRVVRSVTADRRIAKVQDAASPHSAPYLPCGRLEMSHPPSFDVTEHFAQNGTPNCSFAVPREAISSLNIRFDESLPVLEDWQFILQTSMLCGVFDTGNVTSIYHRWAGAESSLHTVPTHVWHETHDRVLRNLDRRPLLLPTGSASRIAKAFDGDASELRACLDNVIKDKNQVIRGLEASLTETNAYLDTVIRDKDRVMRGLEASLTETNAYLDAVIRDRDLVIENLQTSLAEAVQDLGTLIADEKAVVGASGERAALSHAELAGTRQRQGMVPRPTVVVVVVNWNGAHLLPDCLASLQRQSYPADRYRVVVVDNASSDTSVRYVRQRFPGVTVIEARENLGFAGANNLAIGASESRYIALLNNDAVADPGWLDELVALAETDPTIGAVNSRIWLTHDRLVLSVSVSGTFVPGPHDPRRLGAKIGIEAAVGSCSSPLEFTRGAFSAEASDRGTFRWVTNEAEVRVPVLDPDASDVVLRLLPAPFPAEPQPTIQFRIDNAVVSEVTVPADEPMEVRIRFTLDQGAPVVQNAGSIVLPDGAGSDRGTFVVAGQPFYEVDRGQFDVVEDVPAFCGAASLLRREAIEQVGSFDAGFFMYYEDTDLSLRLRRAGWRIVYAPRSTVRHAHSATSVEWSPRFCYFTERNRLMMLMKNAPLRLAAKEWARYSARLLRPVESRENRKRFIHVQRSLARRMPSIVSARRRTRHLPSFPVITCNAFDDDRDLPEQVTSTP